MPDHYGNFSDLINPFGGTGGGEEGLPSGGNEDGFSSGVSAIDLAGMTPEEMAAYFGRGVEGFDVDEFMERFGKFITPFDDTRVNLLQEGFQIGGQRLGSQFNQARGGIRSNLALSAGAEKQRGFVLADYAGRMKNLGLGLSQDVLGEYERYQSDTIDFFRQLAEREIFSAEYWEKTDSSNINIGGGGGGDVTFTGTGSNEGKCFNLLGQEIPC